MSDWLGDILSQLIYQLPFTERSSPEESAGWERLFWVVGIPVSLIVVTIILVRTFTS